MSLAYGVICGDCRDLSVVKRLLGGRKANVVITSPPYADRRKYDESSGFKPIPPDEYVAWYKGVADVIAEILAPDGSYFLNIKEHAEDGERVLYIKELVIAHARNWGWKFVDEFCWRKTDNGVPGGWPNRFKNAWEPVFHFCRQPQIKFRPQAAGQESKDCFDYSNERRWYVDAGGMGSQTRNRENAKHISGIARPSNVIEAKTEGGQNHAAPFPRSLVEFFVKSFSDPGDVVFDPFMGSGTTMISAMSLGRSAFGCEISPGYTDVIVRRAQAFANQAFHLDGCGATFEHVKFGRRLGSQDELKEEAIAAT